MPAASYYESNARQRVRGLFDDGTVVEILPPQARVTSPHLAALGMPVALDDGVMTGSARLDGRPVLFAAEEPAFMGGSVGEVHGAKLTGRLHEANAGLIAISEIQRALFQARAAGVPVIAVCAGANGCYGGLGIVARSCDHSVMTEEGRHSVSGPPVIESQQGVEEFDASDRALVWRTMGGKHRYLIGEASSFALDSIAALRRAVAVLIERPAPLTLETVQREHAALARRLRRFGGASDATEVWALLGVADPAGLPMLDEQDFVALADTLRERCDD